MLHKTINTSPIRSLLSVIFLQCSICTFSCSQPQVIFEDDFNTTDSYHKAITKNATTKEYGDNALSEGHLLKKWNYSWVYDFDKEWTQAFYVVPAGKDYMEQAGRSAHTGNYRLIANAEISKTVKQYKVTFKVWKNDNDPIFFYLGTNAKGDGGIRWGFENQLPGTDKTVDTVYMRGALGDERYGGKSNFRHWAEHEIQVDVERKQVKWIVNGELLHTAVANDLPAGGYFAIAQHYERGTRYDDFLITVIK